MFAQVRGPTACQVMPSASAPLRDVGFSQRSPLPAVGCGPSVARRVLASIVGSTDRGLPPTVMAAVRFNLDHTQRGKSLCGGSRLTLFPYCCLA